MIVNSFFINSSSELFDFLPHPLPFILFTSAPITTPPPRFPKDLVITSLILRANSAVMHASTRAEMQGPAFISNSVNRGVFYSSDNGATW